MAERLQVYKCDGCGNIVEVFHAGDGELVCCDAPMALLTEKTADAATEKHVPVIESDGDGVKVNVGSVPHPMADDHYIEWIEVIKGDRICRKHLNPGDAPEAAFGMADPDSAREHCTVHGHWKSS